LSHKVAKLERNEKRRQIWALRRRVEKLLPNERVAGCQKYPIPEKGRKDTPGVHVCIHEKTGSSFFANLQSCGSVWACVFCAVKITEKRKAELLDLQVKLKDTRIIAYMLTLTFRHKRKEKLADLMKQFFMALDLRFFNRSFWRDYKEKIGLLHFIKVLEVTWSRENGWHIHIHMLLLIDPVDKETGELRDPPRDSEILEPWQSACKSAGLGVPDEHGVKVTSHNAISSYLAKWGLESELTKQHVKKGRPGHYSPFDLIRKCEFENDVHFGLLFKEYYRCFKGRRQMVKSRGFDQFFGIGKHKTDFELANEAVEDATIIGKISYEDYKFIKFHQCQPEILEAAEISGMSGVWDVIKALRDFPAPFRNDKDNSRGQ
jgi:hypothetical protein